jgi:Ca2+-binding RTX toxin-like protein
VSFRTIGAALATGMLAAAVVGAPAAHAKNGDTHITGQGINQTLDCNDSTLLVMGTGNYITAKGSCWAITVQGSSNVIVADNVVDNIIVYGSDQTVMFHTGAPAITDRGRELGMVNRIDQVPA